MRYLRHDVVVRQHHLYASDAVTDGDVTKEARVNYEQMLDTTMVIKAWIGGP